MQSPVSPSTGYESTRNSRDNRMGNEVVRHDGAAIRPGVGRSRIRGNAVPHRCRPSGPDSLTTSGVSGAGTNRPPPSWRVGGPGQARACSRWRPVPPALCEPRGSFPPSSRRRPNAPSPSIPFDSGGIGTGNLRPLLPPLQPATAPDHARGILSTLAHHILLNTYICYCCLSSASFRHRIVSGFDLIPDEACRARHRHLLLLSNHFQEFPVGQSHRSGLKASLNCRFRPTWPSVRNPLRATHLHKQLAQSVSKCIKQATFLVPPPSSQIPPTSAHNQPVRYAAW